MFYEIAALGAAFCWALSGVISAEPARRLGPFAFGACRHSMVAAALIALTLATGGWRALDPHEIALLAASGFVGIFLGDTLLFLTMVRLGPRRTGALFALNAPMAAILGWLVLGETLTAPDWAGVALCASGVAVSVLGRGGQGAGHALEAVRGPVGLGVAFGLLAALGQAGGSLIVRPVMAAGGVDPLTASLVRVCTAALCLTATVALPLRAVRPHSALTWRLAGQVAASGLIAMLVGMGLLLYALGGGQVGIVSTLSAVSPVMILPMLWARTGAVPAPTAWAGAALAVGGMALLFLG